jgi:hypothetical protein
MQSNSNTVNNTPLVLRTACRAAIHSTVTATVERKKMGQSESNIYHTMKTNIACEHRIPGIGTSVTNT